MTYKLVDILREVQSDSDKSFLRDYDTALDWAYENVGDVQGALDAEEEYPDDINTSYMADKYRERIESYVDLYDEIKSKGNIEIHRAIRLKSIDDLDLNDIGMHWSFEYDAAGVYGSPVHDKYSHVGDVYVFTGVATFADIDWKYGFESYIWYGDEQSEIALIRGAKVEITSINKKPLESSMVGVVDTI